MIDDLFEIELNSLCPNFVLITYAAERSLPNQTMTIENQHLVHDILPNDVVKLLSIY